MPVIELFQHRNIHIDELRHIESAHHIFVAVEVNAGLAADAAVGLCEQCRRDLHEINPAQISCRRIPGDVSYHASAKSDQKILPVKFLFDQEGINALYGIQRLAFLTCRELVEHRLFACAGKKLEDRLSKERGGIGICDHSNLALSCVQRCKLIGKQ